MRVALARKARALGRVARRLVPSARPGFAGRVGFILGGGREKNLKGTRSHGQTV